MREYGVVYCQFWTSESTRDFSDDARLLALYLLTGPQSTILGASRVTPGNLLDDLKWGSERAGKAFAELFQNGWATHDETRSWVFVNNFLTWNSIDNPNQGKAAIKVFDQIPDKSPLKPMVARAIADNPKHINMEKINPFLTVNVTVPKGSPNQEQEQGQEQHQEQEQGQHQNAGGNPPGATAAGKALAAQKSAAKPKKPENPINNPAGPVMVSLTLNDGTDYHVQKSQIDEWQTLFPKVDVLQEVKEMRSWLLSNQKERKTRNGILRFINGWLSKEQDRNTPGTQRQQVQPMAPVSQKGMHKGAWNGVGKNPEDFLRERGQHNDQQQKPQGSNGNKDLPPGVDPDHPAWN